MSCLNKPGPSPFISPEYLSEMHSMDIAEATIYFHFCVSHTIRWKECYGDGSIMIPLWGNEKKKAQIAIDGLMV
jgi:hypothetical protein